MGEDKRFARWTSIEGDTFRLSLSILLDLQCDTYVNRLRPETLLIVAGLHSQFTF
jgi:hypothetical protein